MREKFKFSIKFCARRQFRLPGQHLWVGGQRSGALFFALHRDYFVVTRNLTAVYLDLVPSNSFTVTRNLLPSTGTGKKQVTATPRRSVTGSRHLIKPPGRYSAFVLHPDPKLTGRTHYNSAIFRQPYKSTANK